MTRFEKASLNEMSMATMSALWIAGYLEQLKIRTFSDDELKQFLSKVSAEIEEWLKEKCEVES